MKIATVVASNGLVAKELLHVTQHTVGLADNVRAIDFHEGESIDELIKRYRQVIQELDTQTGVVFLLAGRFSCHQYVAGQLASEIKNSAVVTGVNLPMLVSLFLNDEPEIDARLFALKPQEYGRAGVNVVNPSDISVSTELPESNTLII